MPRQPARRPTPPKAPAVPNRAATRGDPDDVRPSMPWRLLARHARRPVPTATYPHACRASRPGLLPWLVEALLLLWAAAQFVPRLPGWASWLAVPPAGATVAVVAAAVAGLFWLVGWEWRRTPRGILMGLGDRNVASLSIAQAMAWTILLVAFTLVALLMAAPSAVDDLGALQSGLGVGTAAGTVLALGGKSDPGLRPADKAVARTARMAVQKDAHAYAGDLVRAAATAAASSPEDPAQPSPSPSSRAFATAKGVLGAAGDEGKATAILAKVARGMAPGDALKSEGVDRVAPSLLASLQGFAGDLAGHVEGQLKGEGDGPDAAAPLLYRNRCPCEARLTDMLQGDEVGNTYQLDVHKLQFLALTLLGLVTLVWVWLHRVGHPFGLQATYPGGILASVGLSSAAYVAAKLPIQTPLAQEA